MIVTAITLWQFEEKGVVCHGTWYLHKCCNSAGRDVRGMGYGFWGKIVGKEALEAERPRPLAAKILARPPCLVLLDEPQAIY